MSSDASTPQHIPYPTILYTSLHVSSTKDVDIIPSAAFGFYFMLRKGIAKEEEEKKAEQDTTVSFPLFFPFDPTRPLFLHQLALSTFFVPSSYSSPVLRNNFAVVQGILLVAHSLPSRPRPPLFVTLVCRGDSVLRHVGFPELHGRMSSNEPHRALHLALSQYIGFPG